MSKGSPNEEEIAGENIFRETIQFYLIDCKTALGKLIDIFIIFMNLFICAIFVIETYPVSGATAQMLWKTEVVIVLFFVVEYSARIYGAKNRLRQLRDVYSIIDKNRSSLLEMRTPLP